MITAIIVFVLIISMIAAGNNGEWGSVAVGAVIVVILLAFSAAGRENARAYNNFVDYWANGGPERKR